MNYYKIFKSIRNHDCFNDILDKNSESSLEEKVLQLNTKFRTLNECGLQMACYNLEYYPYIRKSKGTTVIKTMIGRCGW